MLIVENDVDRSKEEPNEKDDEDLADRNVEICSSSDEDETGDDAYVTRCDLRNINSPNIS